MAVLVKKLKQLSKPSKQRKWNRAQRKLLSVRRLWRMPDPNAERNYVKYLPELNTKVVHPKFFNYNYVAVFLRQVRYLLRKFYGNISERQYNRIHRWFWTERKNRRQTMPYQYFDRVENKLMNLLQRAKWLSKPLWLKFFLRDENHDFFWVNQQWTPRTYRNPTLKKGDTVTIPLHKSLHILLLSKLEAHNLLKLYFNWQWLAFPLKNRWERIQFYRGISMISLLRREVCWDRSLKPTWETTAHLLAQRVRMSPSEWIRAGVRY